MFGKEYNTSHVLIRHIENCGKVIDNSLVAGVVLTDLPKVFDCIPHNFLIAKLQTYG